MITFSSKTKKIIFYVSLFLISGWLINLIFYKPFNINLFFDRVFFTYLWKDPQQLFRLGVLDPYGIKIHYNTLTNISDRYIDDDLEYTARQLEILKSYDFTSMPKAERYSAETLEHFLEDKIYTDAFLKYQRTLTPFSGDHLDLILFFLNVQEVSNVKDLESYLERLHLIPRKIAQIIRIIELGEEDNNIPPQLALEHLVDQVMQFINTTVEENLLFKDFMAKLKTIPDVKPATAQVMTYEIKTAIAEVVIPAYRLLLEKLESLQPLAPSHLGIKTYDTEGIYYTYILKKYTTLDLLSESVFQSIQKDLDTTLNAMNDLIQTFVKQELIEPQKHLGEMVNQIIFKEVYTTSDPAFLIKLKHQIAKTSAQLPFSNYRLDELSIEPCIALFETNLVDFAYYNGSVYNGRAAKLYYNPTLPKSKILLPFQVYSWLIPGYHTQQVVQNSQSGLPIFRRHVKFEYYTGGWKIYSLDLARQLELYESNNVNNLAVLHLQALHQSLGLIDIGIHYNDWSYEKAFKILVEEVGLSARLAELQILAVSMAPGRYVSAVVGYKEFRKKERAVRARRGQAFDLIKYVEEVLTLGPVPIQLFENFMEE